MPEVSTWLIEAAVITLLAILTGAWVGKQGARTRFDIEEYAFFFGLAAVGVFEAQCVAAG